jgi:multiple sugar transport system permease protein
VIGSRRWVVAAAAAAAIGAATTVAVARWAEVRFERAAALRIAATTAAYLAVVTPPPGRPPESTDYDLSKLLVQARALTTLPGWTSAVEVYHGTAPLVNATGAPVPAVELAVLEQGRGPRWRDGVAYAPLKARDGRAVVGAVAVRPARRWGGGAAALLLRWAFPAALLAIGAAAVAAAQRRPLRRYVGAALLLGLAAYVDVRGAARRSTDRWLAETRLLLREAATRLPTPRARVALADLAPLTGGAKLVEADSTTPAPRRVRVAGTRYAVVAARLGAGRWVEVRTLPAEAFTSGWFVPLLALALGGGPLVLRGLRWVERAARRPRELRETATAWGFLAPAALHLGLFSFGSILLAVYLSVHRFGGGLGPTNFVAGLRDPLVWVSLRNTVLYALYVPVSMAIALAVALVLNRRGRAAHLLRTAFVLPYVSSVVAMALVWQAMDVAGFGLLGGRRTALVAVMLLSIWAHVGYQMVVFLAGLQGIPRAYVDAARVDGATAWQRFWRITFPLLRPVTLFLLVTGVIGAFQVFTYVYVLTEGGPLQATDVAVYRVYRTAWERFQFGHASALSLLLFLVLFGVTWAQFALLRKRVEYA